MHDLHELAELEGTHSVAHDINYIRIVDGQNVYVYIQVVGEHDGVAHVWDLTGYETEDEDWSQSLGTLGGSTSVAYAISSVANGTTPAPVIVGESATTEICSMPDPVCAGFVVAYDIDGPNTLTALGSSREDQQTLALGVMDVLDGKVVGASTDCPSLGTDVCYHENESLSWDPQETPALDPNDMDSIATGSPLNDDYGSQTRCINRDGQASGWCGDPTTGAGLCQRRTFFWSSVTATPDNLHDSFFTAQEETQGNAIRDEEASGRIQIVGQEELFQIAYLWERVSGNWNVLEPLDYIEDAADCGVGEFQSANDINDFGQMVVTGVPDSGSVIRSWILSDRTGCDADITASNEQCLDGMVNLTDLLLLLENWGTSGAGAAISSDGGGASEVDLFDLLEMIAQWGVCSGSGAGQSIPQSVTDCMEKFDPGTLELEMCLEAVAAMEQ